ncbi:MAG TPA: folate-binding protein [Burkholderiaceae bacterium]|nr:folate-binding protein [Burkholderiaceae bacterium]
MNAPAFDLPEPARHARGAIRLSDWGVIRARGEDAATFLHGQLTQDVLHLGTGTARLAGYCSAKGRLLATFLVWQTAADEVLLACSADLLPATLKRLSMFVLRSRCKLSDANGELSVWGVAGGDVPAPGRAAARGDGHLLGLPAVAGVARALWVGPAGASPDAAEPLDVAVWTWLEVASGVPRIVAATVEQFVPQMVNLELVGGVNFQKGCYPGQEVVARSQYRGTLKRRAALFACDTAAVAGQEIFHSADPGQPAGLVVIAATLEGRHLLLAETKLAALQGGTLHLASASGARLQAVPLPYTVPVEGAD